MAAVSPLLWGVLLPHFRGHSVGYLRLLLRPERGFGFALLLWMEIQPLGCCFVLRLRLLVASVPGSPAGGRDGACLALDQVVSGSSASGAEFEFWCPGALCGFPVRSTENLSFFLGSFEVVDGIFFLQLLVAPSLEAPQCGPARFGE